MKLAAFDFETYLFEPCNMAPKPVCLSWDDGDTHGVLIGDDIPQWLESQLKDPDTLLAAHSAGYEGIVTLQWYPHLRDLLWNAYRYNRILCTDIRERLLDIRQGHFRGRWKGRQWVKHQYGLGDICERRLDVQLSKGADSWALRYQELEGVPVSQWPQEAYEYSLFDSIYCRQLFMNQEARAQELRYDIPTQYEDTRGDLGLRLTSAWGLETCAPNVDRLWNETIDAMDIVVNDLVTSGLVVPKKAKQVYPDRRQPPSLKKDTKALKVLVHETYSGERNALGQTPLTPKGGVQCTEEILEQCDHPSIRLLQKYSKLEKRISTYLSKLFVPVIHPGYRSVGAASDRTSSSRPNIQNQPQWVRECFKARPGTVYLCADYDSQEMRTLAQACLDICGHSQLAERYKANPDFDPHLQVAAQIAGVQVMEAEALLKAKDLRKRAKVANFGFAGGMGAETFVGYAKGWGLEITSAEAEHLKEMWFETWPEMKDYFINVQNIAGGDLRIPRSGFIRGDVGYCDSANGLFQTPAAHSTKRALFEAVRRCFNEPASSLFGSRPVLMIHDELGLETPEDRAHEAATELVDVMVEAQRVYTPDVEPRASATLSRFWNKDAEPTFREGRLIPWEDNQQSLVG